MGDLADQALEGQLADQELSTLLELADLSEGHGTGTETMGLLHTFVGDVGGLAGSFVSELLARCFGTGILPCGLFSASHWSFCLIRFLG